MRVLLVLLLVAIASSSSDFSNENEDSNPGHENHVQSSDESSVDVENSELALATRQYNSGNGRNFGNMQSHQQYQGNQQHQGHQQHQGQQQHQRHQQNQGHQQQQSHKQNQGPFMWTQPQIRDNCYIHNNRAPNAPCQCTCEKIRISWIQKSRTGNQVPASSEEETGI